MYSLRHLDRDIDLLALHRRRPDRYPHLLESAARGTAQGRYDILFAFPQQSLVMHADRRVEGPGDSAGTFLGALEAWWRERGDAVVPRPGVPFRGGWFVYLGYELAGEIEPTLRLPGGASGLPIAFATRCPAAVVRDHATRRTWLVAEPGREEDLERMRADAEDAAAAPQADAGAGRPVLAAPLVEDEPEAYLDGVERVRRYVRDGDVFQVNLSRAWRGALTPEASPAALYARLRRTNPGPFAGLATWGDTAVVSSSPERLLRVRGDDVETRPIAGTRPREAGGRGDDAMRDELLAHPKERAEHIMLIDLERNDLGRVCATGSVRVDELMVLESYAHVHHIVSNVRGRLPADRAPTDAVRAVFPGGTITGCPKVRCMEIIAELEREARGAYTGSMGYLNLDGDLDLNILIRTLVTEGRRVSLRAGAGIVADSEPARELDETRAKARGVIRALEGEGA